jgi:predicted PhzF superfamily epimerase YddE/YHI9
MELPIFQVDAFASGPFRGNPAAVCPLDAWLPDALMQSIAEENNLAETVFYVPEGQGYRIRWFTPTVEINLCGHATLAAASVIGAPLVTFQSHTGELRVTRDGDRYTLDFPSLPAQVIEAPVGLFGALGATPSSVMKARDHLCVFENEAQIRALKPDMMALSQVEHVGLIATAPGSDCDFVSRFFAPRQGITEDPVTGSAHSTLVPYWSEKLGKKQTFARQISRRGGELWCEDRGDRVGIGGQVVRYMEGRISVPTSD